MYQTAVSLRQMGYRVELVTDCVSSRTPANKALALAKLTANGVGLTGVEMCLYEMVEDCRAPEFKEILGLIK